MTNHLLKAGHVGDGSTYQSIATEMQQGLDLWEGLLKVMGGALVPAKSFWYLIDFQWKEGRWHYATDDETPATLSMLDHNGVWHVLTRLSISEAQCSLGVCSAPNGNHCDQVNYMQEVAEEWSDKLHAGHLTRPEAWSA